MAIDKKLYRDAYKLYQQWNEAERTERLRNAGQLSSRETWQQYVDLVEFCWKLCPRQSERQREQKLVYLKQYYARVKRLEYWRYANGKPS